MATIKDIKDFLKGEKEQIEVKEVTNEKAIFQRYVYEF